MHASKETIGQHIVADIHGVAPELLRDRPALMNLLRGGLQKAGFHQLNEVSHDFPGGGFTAVILLSESHAAVHTYPEIEYLALDIFGCGSGSNPRAVLDCLVKHLAPENYNVTELERRAAPVRQPAHG